MLEGINCAYLLDEFLADNNLSYKEANRLLNSKEYKEFKGLRKENLRDNMDNIEIIVTNYPNEFIVKELYDEHANITSIYPDGVDINNYKISKKQKNDFSKTDLFIYNGLIEKERDLAVDLLSINPDLKIIDSAYVLETDYSPEELWLNPSSLLMMAQNVRIGLEEYITSTYLKKEK